MHRERKALWFRRLKLGVSYACNANCTHCAVSGARKKGVRALSMEEFEALANEARLVGINRVILFGGEPSIHRHVFDIVRVLAENIPLLVMDTNAIVIDDAYAWKVAAAGLVRAQVSIHGPDRETHANLFGRDNFDQIMRGIRALLRHGVDVHFSTVITHDTIKDGSMQRLVDLGHELGVQGIRLLYPKALGQWAGDSSTLLSPEDYGAAASFMDGEFAYLEGEGNTEYSCGAMYRGFFYMSPYGELQPCCYVPVDVGRYREEPLPTAARRGMQDIPWLAPGKLFQDGVCLMAATKGLEVVEKAQGSLVVARGDNHLDLGGAGEDLGPMSDPRPSRATSDILADIVRIREAGHNHVYLIGHDPPSRSDFPEIAQALCAADLSATLIGDARVFATPIGEELLQTLDLLRVIVPFQRSAAADLAQLAQGVQRLRQAQVPVEVQLFDYRAERDAHLLHDLAAMRVEQVSNLPLRDASEDDREDLTDTRQLFPCVGDAAFDKPELLLYRGRSTEPFIPGETDPDSMLTTVRAPSQLGTQRPPDYWVLSGPAFMRLRAFWEAVLESPRTPRTYHFAADLDGLMLRLADLDALLPRIAEAGHAIHIHRCGGEDFGRVEQLEYNRFQGETDGLVWAEPGLAALRRLADLTARYPHTLRARGFGPVVFRPWNTLEDFSVDLVFERLREQDDEPGVRDLLCAEALLNDADPPALPEPVTGPPPEPGAWDDAAWGGRAWRWRYVDPTVARFHKLLLCAALYLDSGMPTPDDTDVDPDFVAVANALDAVPESDRSLAWFARWLSTNSDGLSLEPDTALFLEAKLGLRRPTPTAPPTPAQQALIDRSATLRGLLQELIERPDAPLTGWEVGQVRRVHENDERALSFPLHDDRETLDIRLLSTDSRAPALFVTPHCKVAHAGAGPAGRGEEFHELLRLLSRVWEHYLERVDGAGPGDEQPFGAARALLDTLLTERNASMVQESRPARSPGEALLADNLPLLRRILESLEKAPRSPLPGWSLRSFEAHGEGDGFGVAVELSNATERLQITLRSADHPAPAFHQSRHVKLAFGESTPPSAELRARSLPALCRLIDHYLSRPRP